MIVRDPETGDDKPHFLGVRDILKASAEATQELLKRELEIKLGELEQQWHWDSLERIFIEERIYRNIEKSKTWESVLEEIRKGLKPFLEAAPPRGDGGGHHAPHRDPHQAHLGLQPLPGRRGDEEDRGGHQGDEGAPQEPHRLHRRVV